MLKNILSLLLSRFYSKKDAAEIAALALPNHLDGIAISITEGTNTYIAPADGYINFITARNGGVNVFGQCLQTNSYPSTNRQAKAFVPISKGKKIIFEIGGETISATFYKLIGGGVSTLKKFILQGGGLCLNSLSSSLRRSSLSARRNGWQSNRQFLRAIQSCSLLLPTEKTITSQCPAQGTPTCAVMVFGLPTLTGAPSLTSGLMRTGISASISTPKRVNSLDMLWGLVPNSLRLISIFTRPKAVSNLVVGGASC